MKRFVFGFVVFFVVWAVGALDAHAALALRSISEIDRATVRLSDVFMDVPEGKDKEIAAAPAPGKSVTYEITVLTRLAQRHNLEWQPQTLSDRCLIKRASVKIGVEELREAVIEKIKSQQGNLSKHFEIAFDNKNPDVHLPTDQGKTFVLNNFNYDASGRRFHTDLVAGASNTPVVLPLSGRVMAKQEVPVLARRLDSGTVLSASDLVTTLMPSEQANGDLIVDEAALLGHELRRDMGEGAPLRARDIMPQRFVTRGSLVTMKIETPYMLITAQGRALQDGGKGETIRLTNTQSKRMVEGIVTGAGIVRIPLPNDMVQASAEQLR